MVKLEDLGEWGLIDKLIPLLDQNALAKNDDAVAVKVMEETFVVCNVDILVWKTDVPKIMTPKQAGKKLATMTFSDIIAKGGKPIFFLSGSLFPSNANIEEFMNVIHGVKEACTEYEAEFLGGDLGEADRSFTGVGVGFGNKVVPRCGAEPGDTVWVTGAFGATGAGFHYLFSDGKPIKEKQEMLQSILEPKIHPRLHRIIEEVATASMDSSDGLSISLHELAKESSVKIMIDHLPVDPLAKKYAEKNNLNTKKLVFFGGEEFKVVFTTKFSREKVRNTFLQANLTPPQRIGKVKTGKGVLYKRKPLERKGWEHF